MRMADHDTFPLVSASLVHTISPPDRLPAEYKTLEARVDALREVHTKLLKITKAYESESVSVVAPVGAHLGGLVLLGAPPALRQAGC